MAIAAFKLSSTNAIASSISFGLTFKSFNSTPSNCKAYFLAAASPFSFTSSKITVTIFSNDDVSKTGRCNNCGHLFFSGFI